MTGLLFPAAALLPLLFPLHNSHDDHLHGRRKEKGQRRTEWAEATRRPAPQLQGILAGRCGKSRAVETEPILGWGMTVCAD